MPTQDVLGLKGKVVAYSMICAGSRVDNGEAVERFCLVFTDGTVLNWIVSDETFVDLKRVP